MTRLLAMVVALAVFLFGQLARAEPKGDVILLRDGGRLRGDVMEETPDHLVIVLIDGTTETVARSNVLEVRHGGANTSFTSFEATGAGVVPPPPVVMDNGSGGGLALAGAIVLAVGGAAATGGGILISSAVMDGDSDGRIPGGIGLAIGGGATAIVGVVLMVVGAPSTGDTARSFDSTIRF